MKSKRVLSGVSVLGFLLFGSMNAYSSLSTESAEPVQTMNDSIIILNPKGEEPGIGTTIVQQEPEFPGGQDSLSAFLFRNLRQPEIVTSKGKFKHEFIGFTVDKTGKIKDAKILLSLGEKADAEALRIISLMPDWKPATVAGNPVDKEYVLSIDFFVPDKE